MGGDSGAINSSSSPGPYAFDRLLFEHPPDPQSVPSSPYGPKTSARSRLGSGDGAMNGKHTASISTLHPANDLEMTSEDEILKWICSHTKFVHAELWSFGQCVRTSLLLVACLFCVL